jgi:hypothetical protein
VTRMKLTPVSAVARGVAASAVGTLAMDSLWYRRYRNGGGESGFLDWESSAGLNSWEDAPAPAKVGKILVKAVSGRELGPQYVRLVTNIMHWGYGLLLGAPYGVLVGTRRSPKLWYGLTFGVGVWSADYVVLPAFGVYKQIWKYDAETLRKDLSAHLVFGVATAATFKVLTARGARA